MKKLMTMIAAAAMSFGLFAEFAPHEISYAEAQEDVNPYVLPADGLWTFTGGAPAADEVQVKDQTLLLSTGSKVLARQFEAAALGTEIPEEGNLYADMVLNLNNEILDTVPELDEGTKIALFAMGGEDAEDVGLPVQTNVYVYAAYGEGKALFKLLNDGETFISSARRVAIKAYNTVSTEGGRSGFLLSASASDGNISVVRTDAVYTFDDETKKWAEVQLAGTAGDYLGGITVDGKFGKWIATDKRSLFLSITDDMNNGYLTSVDFKGRAALTSIKLTNADTEQEWPEDSVAMEFSATEDATVTLTQDSLAAGFVISGNKIIAPRLGEFSFTVASTKDNVTVMLGEEELIKDGDVYTAELNPEVTLTVKGWDTAATVGDEKFESLFGDDGAIAYVNKNGGTLKLAKDLPVDQALNITGTGITLDLAGRKLSSTSDSAPVINVVATGDLTITNSVGTGTVENTVYGAIDNAGTLTIQAGTYNGEVYVEDAIATTVTGGLFDKENNSTEDDPPTFTIPVVDPYEVVSETIESVDYWKVQEKQTAKGTVIFICDKPAINTTVPDVEVGTRISEIAPAEFGFAFGSWTNGEGVAVTEVAEGTIQLSPNSVDIDLELVEGAYQVTSAADLQKLQAFVNAGFTCVGKTFKQTKTIDMTGLTWAGIGLLTGGNGSNGNMPNTAFAGTYDGQSHEITNMTLARNKYTGFFNGINGATVKNLAITLTGVDANDIKTGDEYGGAVFFGHVCGTCWFENLTANGNVKLTNGEKVNHNAGGFAVTIHGSVGTLDVTFTNCVNNANVSTDKDKAGGFFGHSNPGTIKFIDCANTGDITAKDMAGGFFGYSQMNATFTRCSNTGVITATAAGQFLGKLYATGKTYTFTAGNVADANLPVYGGVNAGATYTLNGVTYATIAAGRATYVADADLAKDTTYTQMVPITSDAAIFTLEAAGDTFILNTNGLAFAGTVAAKDGTLVVTPTVAGTTITWTAAAKPTEPIPPLPDDPTDEQKQAAVNAVVEKNASLDGVVTKDNYMAFRDWARALNATDPVAGEQAALDSKHVADSFQLGLTALLENDPVAEIKTIAKTSDTALTLTFEIKDGADGAAVAAKANAYVQSLVKCAEDVGFATPIAATVNVSVSGTTLTAEVTLPANKAAAFMKVAK